MKERKRKRHKQRKTERHRERAREGKEEEARTENKIVGEIYVGGPCKP